MEIRDNYQLQVKQAQACFLRYDQEQLIRKLKLEADREYLYATMLGSLYRISRSTGSISRRKEGGWVDANSHSEAMTLLDLVCDSREDRYLRCQWKNMVSFGRMFHRSLGEERSDKNALAFQEDPKGFRRACLALGGIPLGSGDIGYAIELFDGLSVGVQLWLGDEEFAPRLRYLWDENALMYIKYETMYFAVNLLLQRIKEKMKAG